MKMGLYILLPCLLMGEPNIKIKDRDNYAKQQYVDNKRYMIRCKEPNAFLHPWQGKVQGIYVMFWDELHTEIIPNHSLDLNAVVTTIMS